MEKSKSQKCLFLRLPIEISILEDWAKISSDIAKAAIIALPGPIFYYDNISTVVYSTVGLFVSALVFILLGAVFRQIIANREEK